VTDPNLADETTAPDQVETDGAALSSAEDLDEDALGTDPLEQGSDAPEHWKSPKENENLGQKLRAERPDVGEG
jgi:hypothetical protein